jgi:hypothetical protein
VEEDDGVSSGDEASGGGDSGGSRDSPAAAAGSIFSGWVLSFCVVERKRGVEEEGVLRDVY